MHLIQSLYSRDNDFTRSTKPKIELMIATLPRAGSTYFCIELWKTGVLGAPLEYANPAASAEIREQMSSVADFVKYWSSIKTRRTGQNGVFSYKMLMSMYNFTGQKDAGYLSQFAPDKVIYLTRRDKLEQAISYSMAIRSGVWFAGISPKGPLEYDRNHIEVCLRHLRSQESFWENAFEMTKTIVFQVSYEDFVEQREDCLKAICAWMGESYDRNGFMDLPELLIQRDDKNAEWYDRYKSGL